MCSNCNVEYEMKRKNNNANKEKKDVMDLCSTSDTDDSTKLVKDPGLIPFWACMEM